MLHELTDRIRRPGVLPHIVSAEPHAVNVSRHQLRNAVAPVSQPTSLGPVRAPRPMSGPAPHLCFWPSCESPNLHSFRKGGGRGGGGGRGEDGMCGVCGRGESTLTPRCSASWWTSPCPPSTTSSLLRKRWRRRSSSRVWSLSRTSGTLLAASGAGVAQCLLRQWFHDLHQLQGGFWKNSRFFYVIGSCSSGE